MATCEMPTASMRICTREARYVYLNYTTHRTWNYCAQHDRAGGHSAMLRPRPWEYTHKFDTATGTSLAPEDFMREHVKVISVPIPRAK